MSPPDSSGRWSLRTADGRPRLRATLFAALVGLGGAALLGAWIGDLRRGAGDWDDLLLQPLLALPMLIGGTAATFGLLLLDREEMKRAAWLRFALYAAGTIFIVFTVVAFVIVELL